MPPALRLFLTPVRAPVDYVDVDRAVRRGFDVHLVVEQRSGQHTPRIVEAIKGWITTPPDRSRGPRSEGHLDDITRQ